MTQPSPERTPQNKKELRTAASRAALLTGARAVLEQRGYHEATVRLITEAADRSHGTFYLHFENKEDIYATLLDEMRTRLHQESRALWQAEDPLGSLERSIDAYVRSFGCDRALWHLLDGSSATSPHFQAARRSIRRALVQDTLKGIESSRDTAHLEDLDPKLVSEMLAAMLEESCVTFLLHDRTVDPAAITQHMTTLWGRVLGYSSNGYRAAGATGLQPVIRSTQTDSRPHSDADADSHSRPTASRQP